MRCSKEAKNINSFITQNKVGGGVVTVFEECLIGPGSNFVYWLVVPARVQGYVLVGKSRVRGPVLCTSWSRVHCYVLFVWPIAQCCVLVGPATSVVYWLVQGPVLCTG